MARTDRAREGEQAPQATPASKKPYLKQTDVPEFPLDEAIRIPQAIAGQYGKQPTRPADVALALDLLPRGRHFKGLSGSSLAYGLVEGGSQADIISLTELGRRAVAPTEEGDDVAAMREAFLTPRVIREFLERYDGSTLPTDERIARNVLETMGVPSSRTEETLRLIVTTAESLGLLSEVRGKKVVNLTSTPPRLRIVPTEPTEDEKEDQPGAALAAADVPPGESPADARVVGAPLPERNRRVFVSHGSNKKIVEQLKAMLVFGEYEPVVSVERETTSKPVPEKVLDDMRACSAGIIHVGVEKVITDAEGEEHFQLNPNVLIEIGAAMALYGRNYILLVEGGAKLPSNVQGLYEVRYEGSTLDADATMRLLRAFNEFKK